MVLAVGEDADLPGLRPHRFRNSHATYLRQQGVNPAQIQGLLGHASLETTAHYFRAGVGELAATIQRVFD